jgi:hypothetical protein
MSRAPGIGHLLVGQPDVAERMMRALALKGTLPQYIDGDYDPVVLVEDLTGREYDYLRRFIPWSAAFGQAAGGAGVWSLVGIGPKSSQGRSAIAVVDRVWILNQTAGALSYRLGLMPTSAVGSLLAATGVAPIDDRVLNNVPAGQNGLFAGGSGTNAVDPITLIPGSTMVFTVPAGSTLEVVGPWILSGAVNTAGSQHYLAITPVLANTQVNATFYWRERAMMSTEG